MKGAREGIAETKDTEQAAMNNGPPEKFAFNPHELICAEPHFTGARAIPSCRLWRINHRRPGIHRELDFVNERLS